MQLVLVQRQGVSPFHYSPDAVEERFSIITVPLDGWVFQLNKEAGLWLTRSDLSDKSAYDYN